MEGSSCKDNQSTCYKFLYLYMYIVTISVVWGLDKIGLGGWSSLAYYAALCIIIGFSGWLYYSVDNNLRYQKRYNSSFFPALNMNVEQLFDDYLMKKKKSRESRAKMVKEMAAKKTNEMVM